MTDSAAIDEMAEGMTFGVDDGFGDKFDDGLGHETGNGAATHQNIDEGPSQPSSHPRLDKIRGRKEKKAKKMKPAYHGPNIGTEASTETASTSKKRRVIGLPYEPSTHMLSYGTARYEIYDPRKSNYSTYVNKPFTSFNQYNDYTLYMNPTLEDASSIPSQGVRVDDMTAAFVLNTCVPKILHGKWPADFDTAGMIRGKRVPLGYAAKFWKNVGDVDLDGHGVPAGQEGYYYMWWRGLHNLCGKEGLDAKVYQHRPSFETFKCPGFGFKLSARAVVQLPSGHPLDTTLMESQHLQP